MFARLRAPLEVGRQQVHFSLVLDADEFPRGQQVIYRVAFSEMTGNLSGLILPKRMAAACFHDRRFGAGELVQPEGS